MSLDPELLKKMMAQAGAVSSEPEPVEVTTIPSKEEEEKAVADKTMNEIVEEAVTCRVKATPKPKAKAAPKSGKLMFSHLFWKPQSMPDFEVPKFSADSWDDAVAERIPESDTTYQLNKRTVEAFVYSLTAGGTVLLHGETGTGKTSLAREVCARLNIPFMRISCHGQMEQSELVGANSVVNDGGVPITKHSDTDLTLGCKHGGMVVLDEVFRTPPNALMSVQSLLEYPHELNLQDSHGNSRQLEPDADKFFMVLTDNTTGSGDVTGNYVAEVQDTSTRNRIRRSIEVKYMTAKQEQKLLTDKYPDLTPDKAENMVTLAGLVRTAFRTGTCMETMSIRELLTWAQDAVAFDDVKQSFKLSVFNRLTKDDQKVVRDCWNQVYTEESGRL